jgi:undecaprenyl phosphate-alpha-L-ara4FN deformylase
VLSREPEAGTSGARRVALKVDCDTLVGTREGVPALLEVLAAREIYATFFFTLGPDRSGVAARRVFTQRGFLRKMLRSRAASLY